MTQEQLILGATVLVAPLTRIINSSIIEGKFPDEWKGAIVTPILKKGDPKTKENYRPVSCLQVASKVLEKVVNDQMSNYMEKNNLLPQNQHGFRPRRSTMTALSAMQQEWSNNTEKGKKTGILLWDLSAAYDTVNPDLFVEKAKLYGASELTCDWFRSFMSGRSQKVKIGQTISERMDINVGVPQGGILSPLIFIIFGADLEDWIKHSHAFTYADDTQTNCSGNTDKEVILKLEEDAIDVLEFMASNGLVANPNKTVFMMMNSKNITGKKRMVNIDGAEVTESDHSKLLGMNIDSKQNWKEHVLGKSGLVSTLNSNIYCIRRLGSHITKDKQLQVAHSLWMSHLRYGLQLYSRVRTNNEDPENELMTILQKAQNRLLRVLTENKLKDKVKIQDMLEQCKMLSVNQIAAQVKLTEMWKASNIEDYPIKITNRNNEERTQTRGVVRGDLEITGISSSSCKSFVGSASRLWNKAPECVKVAKTLDAAKKQINLYCKMLPV